MFQDLFYSIQFIYIFIPAVLFLAGIYLGPYVVEKDIHILLAYPRWMAAFMEKYMGKSWNVILIFFIILLLNNLSLFGAMLSGFTIILPPVYAFLTGLNISIISFEMMGWKGLWHMLVNPIAWLEFPAAWLSLAFGIKISTIFFTSNFSAAIVMWKELLPLYFKYVFSLLVIAAIIESFMIHIIDRFRE